MVLRAVDVQNVRRFLEDNAPGFPEVGQPAGRAEPPAKRKSVVDGTGRRIRVLNQHGVAFAPDGDAMSKAGELRRQVGDIADLSSPVQVRVAYQDMQRAVCHVAETASSWYRSGKCSMVMPLNAAGSKCVANRTT